jgi:hypothetical protein
MMAEILKPPGDIIFVEPEFTAQSKLNQSPSEGQQSTAVNDVIHGSGTGHVPIARDHLGG